MTLRNGKWGERGLIAELIVGNRMKNIVCLNELSHYESLPQVSSHEFKAVILFCGRQTRFSFLAARFMSVIISKLNILQASQLLLSLPTFVSCPSHFDVCLLANSGEVPENIRVCIILSFIRCHRQHTVPFLLRLLLVLNFVS